ncbi:uncharacterized protein LOC120659104 [Panicum virgatum]|uniref:uncharacterized protein LOC120659104 n=1 Tax=Panicum virgatum TaxID=38727 RepID=UPI0019D5EEA7|nr:uncharacterized protein LOC120659104 [Panicum virgatum]
MEMEERSALTAGGALLDAPAGVAACWADGCSGGFDYSAATSPLYTPLAAGAEDDDLIRTLLPEEVTVSSVIARAVGTGHHMLKVEGYSRLKHTRGDNDSPLLSAEFRAGGHTWKIRCYLDGAHKEDAGFVSLYLSLADPGTSAAIHAEVEFELVDQWPLLPLWCRHRKRLQVTVVEEQGAMEEEVQAEDMERMGVVWQCKDGSCNKLHRARPAQT